MQEIRMNCKRASTWAFSRSSRRQMLTTSVAKDTQEGTVDLAEIGRFAAQKCAWWDLNGPMKALHSMNKVRVPLIRDGLIATNFVSPDYIGTATPLKNLKIIDVGCGGGILTEAIARLGAKVVGLDVSEELLAVAKSHASQDDSVKDNIEFIASNLEDYLKTNKGCFDAIVASEVLEHVTNPELFIKSCVDIIKPGGSLFITTLNKTRLSWLLGVMVAENILNLVPKETHEWEKFISPVDLSRILHKYGCTTTLIHGLAYVFITNKWCCISDTSINYALHAVKISEKKSSE